MNIRKPTDYTTLFAALDALMAAQLPQISWKPFQRRNAVGFLVLHASSMICQKHYRKAKKNSSNNLKIIRKIFLSELLRALSVLLSVIKIRPFCTQPAESCRKTLQIHADRLL